jgi:hypothetical protein
MSQCGLSKAWSSPVAKSGYKYISAAKSHRKMMCFQQPISS